MIIKTLEELKPLKKLSVTSIESAKGRIGKKAVADLQETEELVRMIYEVNLPYYLAERHHIGGESLNSLGIRLGLSDRNISNVFDWFSIPKLTWLEALSRNVEQGIGVHGVDTSGEPYGRIGGRIGGKIGGRVAVERGVGIHRVDPISGLPYRMIGSRMGGIASVKRGVGIHGTDSSGVSYRSIGGRIGGRMTTETQVGVHNPEKRNDYLSTIHGRRVDVPLDAKSTWEANLYRILVHLGFTDIQHDVPFQLNADSELRRGMFPSDSTEFRVDFAATSNKGVEYCYEILAHYYEDPTGLEKILMFHEQHPDKQLIVVSGSRFANTPLRTKPYSSLEQAFAERIRRAKFAGWEDQRYNLKTHPEVFSPR